MTGGLRRRPAEALVTSRRNDGRFNSAEDLALRVPSLIRRELTRLAQIGALNQLDGIHNLFNGVFRRARAVGAEVECDELTMCGRFKLSRIDKAILAEQFGMNVANIPDYADELDNTPGSWRSVITMEGGERKWTGMRWGYVAEILGRKQFIFNAKAENMHYRKWRAILGNRCIIPASGFFEWKKEPGKPRGQKYEITVSNRPVFGFAAIYDDLPNPKTGEMERTFWIITTAPNPKFAEYHDRQPVILEQDEYDEWLTSKEPPLGLLRIFPEDKMLITNVVNAPDPMPKGKDSKVKEPPQPGLFDSAEE